MRYLRSRRNPEGSTKSSGESLVVASKIKALIGKSGLRSSGDLVEALSAHIEQKLKRAMERAKANGRQTIRPEDL